MSGARTPARGRPPVESQRVRGILLDRIGAGRYAPGTRIPSALELMAELGTTKTTIQAVIDGLVADGQIVTRGRQGTFICDQPAAVHRFGLVFPRAANEDAGWNRSWQALVDAAAQFSAEGPHRFEVFTGPQLQAGSASYRTLLAEAERRMFAGLFIIASPVMFANTPLFDVPLPRAFFSSYAVPGQFLIDVDWPGFRRLAVGRLARAGCRRGTVLAGAQLLSQPRECAAWSALGDAAGMALPPEWMIGLDLGHPAMAERVVRLLLDRDGRRPDGILVADDNFLPAVLAGLAALDLAPGRDVALVSHANLPLAPDDDAAVPRIAFDARRMLQAAIDHFSRCQRGEPQPAEAVLVPAELVESPRLEPAVTSG